MSQKNIWNLEIGFLASGEDGERANGIIVAARKRGKPVYGEGPVGERLLRGLRNSGSRAVCSSDLDEIDPGWREILVVR